jgi:hypothetical protein
MFFDGLTDAQVVALTEIAAAALARIDGTTVIPGLTQICTEAAGNLVADETASGEESGARV